MSLRLLLREDGACWGCVFTPPKGVTSAVVWQEADTWHGVAVCRYCFGLIQSERAANRSRHGIPPDSRPIEPRPGDTPTGSAP